MFCSLERSEENRALHEVSAMVKHGCLLLCWLIFALFS